MKELEANPVDFCTGGPVGDDLLIWQAARSPRRAEWRQSRGAAR